MAQPPGNPAEDLDRATHATIARATQGLAPSVLAAAMADWLTHLAAAPGHSADLAQDALRQTMALAAGALDPQPVTDHRFADAGWNAQPFALWRDGWLASRDWWHRATTGLRGMEAHHQRALDFASRQWVNALSPANTLLNPEVLRRARDTLGLSLFKGAMNLAEDATRALTRQPGPLPPLSPGKGLAMTPGKVVARNALAELIRYDPVTPEVYPEPVLIVPAWIMKYYILDLSPQNSLVRWLVAQGFTVYMISWKNPDASLHDMGMEDYLSLGPLAAIETITAETGAKRVHAAGYCLGGTLMAIAAADMARRGDMRLASLTLLAAQTDFAEVGPLALFITEAQITLLEDMMWARGYLDSNQMAASFQLLNSDDLIWARVVRDYLMGDRQTPNDMACWNADGTRMPWRMHSEYLRGLYLENRLAQGRHLVDGHPVALGDLRVPVFAVGTESDTIAPWQSVFKIGRLTDTEVTFVLTSGGHNAGIVSEPGHPHRRFRQATASRDTAFVAPEDWLLAHDAQEGSWWPVWGAWLAARSGPPCPPPAAVPGLAAAPGSYVMQS